MTDIWATPISDTSASLLFMVDLHARHRRSIRLPGYVYAQAGWYFVTICTRERKCLFGDVEGGTMRLNPDGQIVKELWEDLPNHFQYLTLEQFTLMPNHLHGILIIAEHRRGTACRAPTRSEAFGKPVPGSLPTIILSFKSAAPKSINHIRSSPSALVWQRNYYEHVIRNEKTLNRIRQYIIDNPAKWGEDPENPDI
jgi:REP element-mobilizing transposase RayT